MKCYKLITYVPESHLEAVKTALFDAGAGKQGNYDHCCWSVLGEGQFRPLDESQPFLGEQGVVEKVPEYRLEVLCDEVVLEASIKALKVSHPYEEPAFDVLALYNP